MQEIETPCFQTNDIQALTQVLVLPSHIHFYAFLEVFITKGICEF